MEATEQDRVHLRRANRYFAEREFDRCLQELNAIEFESLSLMKLKRIIKRKKEIYDD